MKDDDDDDILYI